MSALLLNDQINKAGSFCLNEQSATHPFPNLFVGDHSLYLESDADEQLLLTLTFNQTVSLKHLVFELPDNESCPQTVKLFINQPSLGFSDVTGIFLHISSVTYIFLFILRLLVR